MRSHNKVKLLLIEKFVINLHIYIYIYIIIIINLWVHIIVVHIHRNKIKKIKNKKKNLYKSFVKVYNLKFFNKIPSSYKPSSSFPYKLLTWGLLIFIVGV